MNVLRKIIVVCSCCAILFACKTEYKVKEVKKDLYPIQRGMATDSAVRAFYYPYKSKIDSQINVVVAHSQVEIKRGKPEGELNNLVADALAQVARQRMIPFDFLHINYKALRVPLPKGAIKAYT